jgi:phenylpropionate dioxygenase-like ring-hydroxylating dioxygenase large terminal subunit
VTYVRNAWYVAAWSHELARNQLFGVRVLNEPIVLWRDDAGVVAAFEDRCVHRLAPLSLGRCEGNRLRCMYHGLLYDRAGTVVEIPGQERSTANLSLRKFPTAERFGWIWLFMGDADAAREEMLPPLLGLEQDDYTLGSGQLEYAAEARLVHDNLLDLSHVSFLHEKTFRMTDVWARERPTVTEFARSVRSERWIENQGVVGSLSDSTRVDTYFSYEVFVPGVLLMTVRSYPVGTASTLDRHHPAPGERLLEFTSQAVTPLTPKTARYFYIMGEQPRRGTTSYDLTNTERAFAEDKAMIEAQQSNIDLTPGYRFRATTADRGVVAYNRLVSRLIGLETGGRQDASGGVSQVNL